MICSWGSRREHFRQLRAKPRFRLCARSSSSTAHSQVSGKEGALSPCISHQGFPVPLQPLTPSKPPVVVDWASGVSPKPDPKTISKHVQRMVDVSTHFSRQNPGRACFDFRMWRGEGARTTETKVGILELIPLGTQSCLTPHIVAIVVSEEIMSTHWSPMGWVCLAYRPMQGNM